MSSLLKFLLKLLTAKMDDDGEAEPDEPVEEVTEETEEEEPEESIEEPEEEPEEETPQQKRQSAFARERNARKEAEAKYQKAQEELEAARRQTTQSTVSPDYQREMELRKQEDAILNNTEATDWQKYAVQSARDSRMAAQTSQKALREAKDINDKAEFRSLKTSQGKTFEKLEPKVESMLKEMRKNGQDAPRKELYYYILGKELAENKTKISTTKSSEKTGGVKRGSTPGAKSDVSSRDSGRLTEAEKRTKRLENVRI